MNLTENIKCVDRFLPKGHVSLAASNSTASRTNVQGSVQLVKRLNEAQQKLAKQAKDQANPAKAAALYA